MPKRPCAIDITHDNSTILSADKFGDVYALPLLGQTFEVQVDASTEPDNKTPGEVESKVDAFVSKANALTVHTKRNRDVLLQQQRLKAKKPVKKHTAFDHELILGHVSLLTDLTCVSIISDNGVPRDYVLTCDRDEHIRISRGHPQAHIIENYCLGHTSFVSQLCVSQSDPEMLVSGGGDDEILLWHWSTGQVRQRINLKRIAESSKSEVTGDASRIEAITVNHIIFVPTSNDAANEIHVSIERWA